MPIPAEPPIARWRSQLASMGIDVATPSGAPAPFRSAVDYAAATAALPARLVAAVASVESAWNPSAISRAGAIGLMQLMPRAARELGVNPWDPSLNLLGGATYLRRQLDRFDDVALALAAYNAGPARAEGFLRGEGRLPAETSVYVDRVLARMRTLTDARASRPRSR